MDVIKDYLDIIGLTIRKEFMKEWKHIVVRNVDDH